MIKVNFAALLVLMCSCVHNKNAQTVRQRIDTIKKNNDTVNRVDVPAPPVFKASFGLYRFDTAREKDSPYVYVPHPILKIKHWSQQQDYWSVYKLGDNLYCIAFDLDETEMNLVDSLFNANVIAEINLWKGEDTTNHDKVIDTTVSDPLREDKKFTKAVLQNDTARWFYVYCTKGRGHFKIRRIFYNYGPCKIFAAFELTGIDTIKYGMPIIASQRRIDMSYTPNPNFQRDMEQYHTYKYTHYYEDGMDSIAPKLFAFNDSLFMAYTDDFKSYKPNSGIYIPERYMFFKVNNKIEEANPENVDFFGTPCD